MWNSARRSGPIFYILFAQKYWSATPKPSTFGILSAFTNRCCPSVCPHHSEHACWYATVSYTSTLISVNLTGRQPTLRDHGRQMWRQTVMRSRGSHHRIAQDFFSDKLPYPRSQGLLALTLTLNLTLEITACKTSHVSMPPCYTDRKYSVQLFRHSVQLWWRRNLMATILSVLYSSST